MRIINHTKDINIEVYNLVGSFDCEKWDNFVLNSQQANPFSTSTWLKAYQDLLNYQVDLWIIERGGEWVACLPVFWKKRFGQKACVNTPLTAYSTVLLSNAIYKSIYPSKIAAEHLEITGLFARNIAENYSTARHDMVSSVRDVRSWMWTNWSVSPSYTYHIDLTKSLGISHSVRKNVRKSIENKLTFSLEWDLEKFWSVMEDTLSRQKISFGMAKAPFFKLAERLHNVGIAWMASAVSPEGEIYGARIELGLEGSNTLFDWVAGSSVTNLSSGSIPWLMTMIAEEAKKRCYQIWDLGGANYETIAKFKSEFGGDLVNGFSLSIRKSMLENVYQRSYLTGGIWKRKLRIMLAKIRSKK